MCGASQSQNQIEGTQQNFYNQMISQASQVFNQSSTVFQNLMNTFSPTVAAGPSQYGFSNAEDANLRSGAITQAGQGYKNEKQALGDTQAAQGGGRAVLPGGANIASQAALAENYGNQTSNALSEITQAGYTQGNKNYNQAVAGMAASPGVFSTAGNYGQVATGAGGAAASTANQIATQNNSWIQSVTGALGGIAGAAMPGVMGMLGGAGSAAASVGDTLPSMSSLGGGGSYNFGSDPLSSGGMPSLGAPSLPSVNSGPSMWSPDLGYN